MHFAHQFLVLLAFELQWSLVGVLEEGAQREVEGLREVEEWREEEGEGGHLIQSWDQEGEQEGEQEEGRVGHSWLGREEGEEEEEQEPWDS